MVTQAQWTLCVSRPIFEVEDVAFTEALMTCRNLDSTHRSAAYQTSCRHIVVSENLDTTLRPKIKSSPIAIDETTEYRRRSKFHAGFGVELAILMAPARKEWYLSHQWET